jgi:hypothetical protein
MGLFEMWANLRRADAQVLNSRGLWTQVVAMSRLSVGTAMSLRKF